MKEREFDYDYVKRVALKWAPVPQVGEEWAQDFYIWWASHLSTWDPNRGPYKKWFDAHLAFKMSNYRKFYSRRAHYSLYYEYEEGDKVQYETGSEDGLKRTDNLISNDFVDQVEGAMTRAQLLKYSEKMTKSCKRFVSDTLRTGLEQHELADMYGHSREAVQQLAKKSIDHLRKALKRGA